LTGGRTLRVRTDAPYRVLVGVGGIGAGIVFALDGSHELGRNESRPGRLLDARDYCKLHIIAHYPAVLLGARPESAGPGFRVVPVGRVGEDEVGRRLRREMEAAGMDTRFVQADPGHPTLFSVCFQYADGSGGNVTTSVSAASSLTVSNVEEAGSFLGAHTIALAAPEAPWAARLHLLTLAGARGALRVAAFTSAEMEQVRATGALRHVDLLALNEDEAAALLETPFPAGDPVRVLDRLAAMAVAANAEARVVVTAGRRGAWGFENARWANSPALAVEVSSTAGAGDALLGGILTGLAVGLPFTRWEPRSAASVNEPLQSALELGTLAAGYKVTSPHTIPAEMDLDALLAFGQRHGISLPESLAREDVSGPRDDG
jgi:sugar/nucleoside kinase (ribokinase family)